MTNDLMTGGACMSVFLKLWNFVRRLIGLVLPVFAKARDWPSLGNAALWALRIVLLVVFLAALWFLQYVLELDKILPRAPTELVRKFWLPILGLLFIVLCWLGWWLWQLLGPEQHVSAWPDIEEAWDEAMHALNQAGLDVTEVPLFLVLGRPLEGEEALFAAADLRLAVKGAPQRANAPLHV